MKKRNRTDFIVIHASATKTTMDIGAAEIRKWHTSPDKNDPSKPWQDIGYHYVIRRDGTLEDGRDLNTVGSHVAGYNSRSVGICLVGGVSDTGRSENNFTKEQFQTLETLVKKLTKVWPHAIVQGHRDFPNVKKDCPCFDVRDWWDNVSDN